MSADLSSAVGSQDVLSRLRRRSQDFAAAAAQEDRAETFPDKGMDILRASGCLTAVLPPPLAGMGLGWMQASTNLLFDMLRAIGASNLACARLFEGHVNAFQLLWTFGNAAQRGELCLYVQHGGVLGVWNAPSPAGPLMLVDQHEQLLLSGFKAYASGAGGIERPLVTARHAQRGLLMVWADPSYTVGPASDWTMNGMRATMTRGVSFDGEIRRDQIFGQADDYHSQPQFSGGCWRFLAAQIGAGEAIAEMTRNELIQRGRTGDAHQRARMAHMVTSLETASKWAIDGAHLLANAQAPVDHIIQHANGARMVVERCLLDVMEMAQRSVGLPFFSRDHPGERIVRDLATYLRQPAPDALLESVGAYGFAHGMPTLSGRAFDDAS